MTQALFFYYFSGVTILSAVLTVALRNPVYCGLSLLSMLLHVAGLFVILNAEFIAAVQVIIYAGAILVLYLFVLMLLNLKSEERTVHSRYAVILFLSVVVGGELLLALLHSPFSGKVGEFPAEKVIQMGHSYTIGVVLFNDYLLPFEIVGVFLLGGIIGAIVLAKDIPS